MLAVYSLGELVRKKFKLKSILYNDTSNNEVKQRIISLMQENPNIAVGEIADIVGLYVGHTEDYIRELKKSGLVKREGKLKNRQWIVK
jgi:predicted HTH transcriptional regulator